MGKNSFDIYVGNDVYGRGTYGGGKENTYIAINEILKYPLSIALFA
jgi:mannosyl-glycoprotein endo-beta-N-acetylglucosaminidase